MRTVVSIAAICLLVAATVPAVAGEAYKCDAETEACLEAMASKLQKKGWVGLEMDYDEATGALTVAKVIPDSPAQAAGFKAGDVLAGYNGIAYTAENKAAIKEAHNAMRPGQTVSYTVKRNDEPVELTVKLAGIPETVMAQWIGQHMLMAHVDHETEKEEAAR